MLSAFATAVLFLTSYLYYHYHVGSVSFQGEGLVRPIYFSILISHTTLAAAIVPLALVTLYRALREDFTRHRRIARWTLPLWLYVSVTGIVVYLMLYQLEGGVGLGAYAEMAGVGAAETRGTAARSVGSALARNVQPTSAAQRATATARWSARSPLGSEASTIAAATPI